MDRLEGASLGYKRLLRKKAWDRPAPPPVVGEVYIWIFTRFVVTAQTLTNLVGSRFSVLQPPQILALPPCACPIPPGPRGPFLVPAEQEPEGSVEPGPRASAEQLWLQR